MILAYLLVDLAIMQLSSAVSVTRITACRGVRGLYGQKKAPVYRGFSLLLSTKAKRSGRSTLSAAGSRQVLVCDAAVSGFAGPLDATGIGCRRKVKDSGCAIEDCVGARTLIGDLDDAICCNKNI